ncbi:arsenate reductase [Shimia isoporae]|uniref:Arsenate reductase n=1 Tax=Shimia isoporae TaxID=647720 RepID=A0A4R1NKX5_9RHOB|nr:ArsC/Spx/MgsR family protein [Shimia isoporae]TCL08976.1 arsenate reductase [Shimia isoporae]
MRLYGLKNCDTCRKALKALNNAEFIDVRTDGVPADIMTRAFDEFGDRLLNTRSTTWRQLDAEERQKPVLELLSAYPTLMKRPLIESGDVLYLGWTKEVQAALG